MQEESDIIPGSENDPDNPMGILARLGNRIPAALIPGKIIVLPKDIVKFVCKNHEIKTVIELKDNSYRHKNNKMIEFNCSCGTIYKKGK